MPHSSARKPISTVSIDDFEAWPEFCEVRQMYENQKRALHDLATQGLGALTGVDAQRLAQEIAALLHNISGTAAYFGEAPMGLRACELEPAVRSASTQQLLHPRCHDVLATINQGNDA